MPHAVHTGTVETIQDLINGTLAGNAVSARELPLGGKTIVFTTPAATVTFTGAPNAPKTLAAAAAEIEAQAATVVARTRASDTGPHTTSRDGDGKLMAKQRLSLQRDTGFAYSGGTALADLGLPPTHTSDGLVAAARIIGFTQGPVAGQLVIIISP